MMNPGTATRPKACFQPQRVATIPPIITPMSEPRGMDAFQRPIIRDRFSTGYIAESMAVPPGE